jgi:2-polyprenyl-3-methyl-5-hydroxy-6-metoxy-1,4-benzoquinol methylase
MSLSDKEKWNNKYEHNPIPNAPIKLIEDYAKLAHIGDALDIACGMGRHSKYLASLGFHVYALDISSVAIEKLQNIDNIQAIAVDFDTYTLSKEKYDLIVCTYFLERKLFPQMIKALKSEGVIIIETFIHDENNEKEPSNPSFLLQKGELESYFEPFCNIIYMKQWWDSDYTGKKMMKVSMFATKKP